MRPFRNQLIGRIGAARAACLRRNPVDCHPGRHRRITATLAQCAKERRAPDASVAGTSCTAAQKDSRRDIVLTDICVSARRASTGFVKGKVVLRDLQSTNDPLLNEHVHWSITEVELRSGDTIFFGGHQADQFRFVTA